jgi:hypothetical protein
VVVTLIYTAIYSFRSVSTEQISIKYGLSQEDAGFYLSVIDIVCLVCSPFFGYLVDCTGKKGWMGTFTCRGRVVSRVLCVLCVSC